MPRALRPVFGPSIGSAVVAVGAVVSLVAYLTHSRAVTLMQESWSYLDFVLAAIAKTPHAKALAFGFAPSLLSSLTFVLFVASCVGIGLLVARVFADSRAAAPMAWVAALAASVVPTLMIATVRWPDGGGSITNVTIVAAQAVTLALVWLWSRRAMPSVTRRTHSADAVPTFESTTKTSTTGAPSRWMQLCIALAVCYALTILLNGFTGIFGFDSFSNHLTVADRWRVLGRLERGSPSEIVTFYPGNFELLIRWTLSLGTDRLAFLLSFGSSVACVWVIYRVALELGQSRTAALLSALGAASLQVLAYQSIIVLSDSYLALCLLLATWLLLIWVRDGAKDQRLTAGFALALGMGLGAKYSAGPPAVVLGLVWLWFVWSESRQQDDDGIDHVRWTLVWRNLAIFTMSVLPPMAYWYVRNAIDQHNPLYPLSVAGLPGINIGALLLNAPGPQTTLERATYAWTEVGHVAGFETGLGPLFASVALLGVFAAPWFARRPGFRQRLAWLILLGAYAAWWRTGVLVPRYGLYPLLMTFVFVGELWSAFASRLLGAVIGACIVATMFSVGHEMLGGAAYNELFFDPNPRVPAVIDSLPPSRILNAAGEPSGYYAKGRDSRHHVISLFQGVTPADVGRYDVDLLLLPQSREPEFASLGLQLLGRWSKEGQPPTSLWRVPASQRQPVRP